MTKVFGFVLRIVDVQFKWVNNARSDPHKLRNNHNDSSSSNTRKKKQNKKHMKKHMKKWLHFASCRRGELSRVQHMFHQRLLLLLLSSAARATTTMWLPCCSLGEAKTIISSISAKVADCLLQTKARWVATCSCWCSRRCCCCYCCCCCLLPISQPPQASRLQMKHSSCAAAALAICNSFATATWSQNALDYSISTMETVQRAAHDERIPLAALAACHTLIHTGRIINRPAAT